MGSIMTGFLAKNSIAAMADSSIKASGAIDGNVRNFIFKEI